MLITFNSDLLFQIYRCSKYEKIKYLTPELRTKITLIKNQFKNMLEWLFGSKKQQPQKKKEKKPEAEDKWMYEFMVQFLSSPIWRVSILDFVDNKCIVFDNEEQNKFEYTLIHNDFKELVGNLVDGMMDEIGMSQQKLAEIIQKGLESKQRKLFNQLLLADDFLRFKELMVKRNKALEQQAIKALHESHNSSTNASSEVKQEKLSQETEIIRESQRMERQRRQKIQQEEEQQLRKAIQLSKIQSKQSEAMKQLQKKANDKSQDAKKQIQTKSVETKKEEIEKEKPESISINSKSSKLEPLKSTGNKPVSQLGDLPPIKAKVKQEPPEISQPYQQEIHQPEEPQKQQTYQEQPSESMEDRKQRLVAQRERIRKQKEEERRKQLQFQSMEKQTSTAHQPVHTIVLQEDGFYDESRKKEVSNQPVKEPQQQVSEGELKRRKQLMNRIKNKIIEDF